MRWNWKLIAGALGVFSAESAFAFNGERAGFMLGLGLGVGRAKQVAEASAGDVGVSLDFSNTGLGTDFKIGGGVSDQLWIYYHARSTFYSYDAGEVLDMGPTGIDITAFQGINGIAVSYFLSPQAPSVLFSGTLGLGYLSESNGSTETETGFGLEGAVGFELTRSLVAEIAFMHASLASETDVSTGTPIEVDLRGSNLTFTLSWVGY
jgi:hypothetical protein